MQSILLRIIPPIAIALYDKVYMCFSAMFSMTVTHTHTKKKRVLFDPDLTFNSQHEAYLKSCLLLPIQTVNLRNWALLSQGVEIILAFSYF